MISCSILNNMLRPQCLDLQQRIISFPFSLTEEELSLYISNYLFCVLLASPPSELQGPLWL